MKAFILAAGLGTRLRPLTDTLPKALVPYRGIPMLQHRILALKAAGFTQFVINIHHFGQQILDFLEAHRNFGVEISISDERDLLRDTGGALRHAAPLLRTANPDEAFLVHNVDIFSNMDLTALPALHRPEALATLIVSPRRTSRYFLFDARNRLCGWTNVQTGACKPSGINPADCTALAFSGIHIVSNRALDIMQDYPPVFSIVDFYLDQCGRHAIYACIPEHFNLIDAGKANRG